MLRPVHTIILAGATFIALVPPCRAVQLTIIPTLDLSQEEALARQASTEKADTLIEGKGKSLRILYSSAVRIDADLAILRGGASFDPTEILHFTLPAGKDMEATVDLTVTPGWSPFTRQWRLFLASPPSTTSIDIHTMEFVPSDPASVLRTIAGNVINREVFQVSTFHALRGYRILGFSLATILGIFTFAAAAVFLGLRSPRLAMTTFTVGSLLYVGWFGIDLARFTAENLTTWLRDGVYNKAGAAAAVADALRSEAKNSPVPLFVYVCHDTTDFYAKVLRYMLYPTPVSVKAEDIPRTTHVLVAGKIAWNYRDGLLTCGNVTGAAHELAQFRDGAVLYASAR